MVETWKLPLDRKMDIRDSSTSLLVKILLTVLFMSRERISDVHFSIQQ